MFLASPVTTFDCGPPSGSRVVAVILALRVALPLWRNSQPPVASRLGGAGDARTSTRLSSLGVSFRGSPCRVANSSSGVSCPGLWWHSSPVLPLGTSPSTVLARDRQGTRRSEPRGRSLEAGHARHRRRPVWDLHPPPTRDQSRGADRCGGRSDAASGTARGST